MDEYFDNRPCFVCGRRECIHKQNDRERDPTEFVVPKCNRCHGTGYVNVPSAVTQLDMPNRNDPCPCGSKKKWKHCCIDLFKRQIAPTQRLCSCTYKAYAAYMADRVKLPCSICGQVGYCKHRPNPGKDVARKMQQAVAERMAEQEVAEREKKAVVAARRSPERMLAEGTRKLLKDEEDAGAEL